MILREIFVFIQSREAEKATLTCKAENSVVYVPCNNEDKILLN